LRHQSKRIFLFSAHFTPDINKNVPLGTLILREAGGIYWYKDNDILNLQATNAKKSTFRQKTHIFYHLNNSLSKLNCKFVFAYPR